ncbi:MAG: tripartite tricarboxylate transporter substrate binding protein [Betaproteobacteria bacterium]
MKFEIKKYFLFYIALIFLSLLNTVTHAQTYPDRPIKIVVPFPPGGNVDISARIISLALTEELGQTVIVENKPGAAGFLGAMSVVKSRPDGYTLLIASNSAISIGPLLNVNAPYDPLKDFTPISLLAQTPLVIEVNSALPVKSVHELIALLKSQPGKVSLGSPSSGSINHMAIEMFQLATNTKFNIIHYKGNAPAVNDLVAGHVVVSFDQITSSLQQIKSGRIKALAVTSLTRASELPDIPTLDELGFKSLEAVTFTAMLGPQGMSADVVTKLNTSLNKILRLPSTIERFKEAGAQTTGSTASDFSKFLENEQRRWKKVIIEANIKSDG